MQQSTAQTLHQHHPLQTSSCKPRSIRRYSLLASSTLALFSLISEPLANAAQPVWSEPLQDNVIVVGGTMDPHGEDQLRRMDGWFDSESKVRVVNYPANIVPLGGPGYDKSAAEGTEKTSSEIKEASGPTTVVGMSQGAKVAGDAVQQNDTKEESHKLNAVLLADPRFPSSGVEQRLKGLSAFGISGTGERKPTQHVKTTSICIKGDPVCSLSGHPANYLPGFICIHGGACKKSNSNYAHLDELEVSETWKSGETTYVTMNAPHPWRIVAEEVGVPISDEDEQLLSAVMPVGEPGKPSALG